MSRERNRRNRKLGTIDRKDIRSKGKERKAHEAPRKRLNELEAQKEEMRGKLWQLRRDTREN